MPFAASHSTAVDLSEALEQVCGETRSRLDGLPPDLTFLFISHDHADHFEELPRLVREHTGARVVIGCTGETVVGGDDEMESGPAVSLWSAILPDAELIPFHAEFSQTPDGVVCSGLPSEIPDPDAVRAVFVLGEPFTSAPNSLIDRFADSLPGVPLLGGMASGAMSPGENRLFLDGECLDHGAVGVILQGGPRVRSLVSQGCRPIGTHYVVTKARENIISELGGVPPLQRLQEFLPTLPPRDQMLARQGLHLGLVMNEYQEKFERGDFLISNVIGADQDEGAIAIANLVRVGQTVQFHVRDAETADEDLTELLDRDRQGAALPKAALLFSCNGRGTRLFAEPNHDAETIQGKLGPVPLAGLFAQGELGPVGRRNYVHGFTASVALFEE